MFNVTNEETAKSNKRRSRFHSRSRGSKTLRKLKNHHDRDPPSCSPNAQSPIIQPPLIHLTPLSTVSRLLSLSPSPSHASSKATSARRESLERNRDSALALLTRENQFEYEFTCHLSSTQPRLIVEEIDDLELPVSLARYELINRANNQPLR